MNGLWGYVSKGKLNKNIIRHIISLASTRGPHAHGAVWFDKSTEWVQSKILGPVDSFIDDYISLKAQVMLGHTRLATSGDVYDITSIQPFIFGKRAFAHNGNFYNAPEFRTMETIHKSDSYILGKIICEDSINPIVFRLGILNTPYVIIVMTLLGFTIVRDWLPLFIFKDKKNKSIYFCSREFEGANLIDNKKVVEVAYEGIT